VTSVIQNIDVLKTLFATMMRETAQKYLPLTKGFDDKAKERAIAHFEAKETREEFYKFFRQLQNLHEIISPDAFMRPFIDDFEDSKNITVKTIPQPILEIYKQIYNLI
jgi:type I restriction enzyme R subunit